MLSNKFHLIFSIFLLILIQGCGPKTVPATMSIEPEFTKMRRVEIETVSLQSRLIVIEKERPIYTLAPIERHGPKDKYIFWDYCRKKAPIWQLVELRRLKSGGSKWHFVMTSQSINQEGRHIGSPVYTEGELSDAPMDTYEEIKKAGLEFFKPGLIKCQIEAKFILDS